MDIWCRPMEVRDYGVVETQHWTSADQVEEYIERQGIASMLAFSGQRYLGQLYLQEYDSKFSEPGGWTGHRPWADFQVAEPLGLGGRLLTLGCYHVGWMPDGSRDRSLWGRGIGTALLEAVIEWYRVQTAIDGLVSWALVPGCKGLLQWAGQLPYTVYQNHGFREIKQVDDPRWTEAIADITDPEEATEDLTVLRVMLLSADRTAR
jgi:GNAT superfamily N-acetyltransferase